MNPTETKSWEKLSEHAHELSAHSIADVVENRPNGVLAVETPFGIYDFRKNLITTETLSLFKGFLNELKFEDKVQAYFDGEKINHTENRAVLHTALRSKSKEFWVDGENIMPKISAVLEKMKHFSNAVREGEHLGYTGKKITDIVNIGIGGSDLGPKMAYEALLSYKKEDIDVHYVSNIDHGDLYLALKGLHPQTTLFVIASKTFTTLETMTNAKSAKEWFLKEASIADVAKHFVAVSVNQEKVVEFGIDPHFMFEFWDWVGGRFSVWSAIGLSLCIALGFDEFEKFLSGADWMDQHFRESPLEQNIPLLMAVTGVWYHNFFGWPSHAVLPYDHGLRHFPSYLQQADMESNGKSIDRNGNPVNYQTGPILFGQAGTNGQHAFYQLLHQGTDIVPCDFIGFCQSPHSNSDHRQKLMANFFAQPEALLKGKSASEVIQELETKGYNDDQINDLLPYKIFEGNRPSNSFLFDELNPFTLGALMATYEHKIFAQGVIWNINSFDQWGVELGKELAKTILPELNDSSDVGDHDNSTASLIAYFKSRDK